MSKWPEVALGDIFDIARGGSPRPIDDYITDADDGVNWISISDASDSEKFITKTKKKIIKEGVARSRSVKSGDFLLTNSMSFGRPYIMATDGCIHDGWLVLRKKNDSINQDYFFHLLGSESTYRKFKSLAAGAVVKNLNIDLVKSVTIPLPPLEEQKRIAAVLDKADSLRRKRAQAIALADDFLRATFLDMFGDPVTNPKGWDTVKLEELILSGPTNGLYKPSSDYVDADGELGVPILRIDGFYNGRIAKGYKFKRVLIDSQTKLKFLLRDKSIVINRVNSKEYVGKAMLVSGLQEATVFESNMMNFSVSLSSVNPRFLVDQLADEFVRRQVAIMRKDAVNQSSINQNDVKSIEIRLPKLGLQEKYTEVAEAIDLLVKKYNEASDDSGCFSDSLRARLLA